MSIALDVGIGVVFLYLMLALTVTICQELLTTLLASRAKHLYGAIASMLEGAGKDQQGLVRKFYEHPLIRNLSNEELELTKGHPSLGGKGLPSYIPSKTFALALIDVLRKDRKLSEVTGADRILASASEVVATLPEGRLKQALSILLTDAERFGQDVDQRSRLVSERIEGWFNDRMARASGWYKRRAQVISIVLALGVTLAFNADTLHVAGRLWNDAALRAGVVAAADAFAKGQVAAPPNTPEPKLVERGEALASKAIELQNSGVPVGWQNRDWAAFRPVDYLLLALGWLLTALAVSLGAAFWFDILSKALQLRGSGLKVSASTGVVANGSR
jgi:hypothetical protein